MKQSVLPLQLSFPPSALDIQFFTLLTWEGGPTLDFLLVAAAAGSAQSLFSGYLVNCHSAKYGYDIESGDALSYLAE